LIMSNPVIFKDLPATFPEKDRYQRPSLVSSVLFHVLLIIAVVVVPLMLPRHFDNAQLLTFLVSPLPPPPAALPAPVAVETPQVKAAAIRKPVPETQVNRGDLIAPVAVPRDIARIVDEPIEVTSGVIGGVPGGMPGGVAEGILGGILAANARVDVAAPPLPPPPPPPPPRVNRQPIRVGGNIKEPQIIKIVPPVYPVLASKARVSGTVVLEATLTTEGTVEEIRLVSGHPLLVNAAIDCVRQWMYEPTYLNGQPVAVILTATVVFRQRPTSQ
jgi:periplasmic protein TonB